MDDDLQLRAQKRHEAYHLNRRIILACQARFLHAIVARGNQHTNQHPVTATMVQGENVHASTLGISAVKLGTEGTLLFFGCLL